MKRIALVIAVSIPTMMMSSVASAGDVETVPYTHDWNAVYVGLHAGYGWSDATGDYDFGHLNDVLFNDVGLSPTLGTDLEGYIVGGQLGIQRQFGRLVLGIEGSLSAGDIDGSSSEDFSFNDISCPFGCFGLAANGTQTLDVKIDDLFTLTGKIGYAHHDWLAYFKGGYASADIAVNSSINADALGCIFVCVPFDVASAGSSEKRHDGWIIGGGLERKLAENLSIGVEYNYIRLDARTHSIDAPLEIGNHVDLPGGHKVRVDPDEIHTVSLRLNFLLDVHDHAPVEAPLK